MKRTKKTHDVNHAGVVECAKKIKTNESKKAKRKQTTRAHPFNKGSERRKKNKKKTTNKKS